MDEAAIVSRWYQSRHLFNDNKLLMQRERWRFDISDCQKLIQAAYEGKYPFITHIVGLHISVENPPKPKVFASALGLHRFHRMTFEAIEGYLRLHFPSSFFFNPLMDAVSFNPFETTSQLHIMNQVCPIQLRPEENLEDNSVEYIAKSASAPPLDDHKHLSLFPALQTFAYSYQQQHIDTVQSSLLHITIEAIASAFNNCAEKHDSDYYKKIKFQYNKALLKDALKDNKEALAELAKLIENQNPFISIADKLNPLLEEAFKPSEVEVIRDFIFLHIDEFRNNMFHRGRDWHHKDPDQLTDIVSRLLQYCLEKWPDQLQWKEPKSYQKKKFENFRICPHCEILIMQPKATPESLGLCKPNIKASNVYYSEQCKRCGSPVYGFVFNSK